MRSNTIRTIWQTLRAKGAPSRASTATASAIVPGLRLGLTRRVLLAIILLILPLPPTLALVLSAHPTANPAPPSAPARSASAQRNEAIGRRYFEEVWNNGRVDVLDELLTADYINHTPSTPNPPPGPAGLKPIVQAIRRAFPDLHYTIEDVVASDDAVVLRVVMTGTHRGDLFGLPPTGRKVSVSQINIEHVRDGRIAEHWRVTDEYALMKQLGAVN